MNKQCIKCGAVITHHHKYCERHYPQKSATILKMKKQLTGYRRAIEQVLNPAVNKNRYVTKKQLKSALLNNGIKEFEDM